MSNNQKPMADRLFDAMKKVCADKVSLCVPPQPDDVDMVMSEACDYIRGLESVLELKNMRPAGWAIFTEDGRVRYWSSEFLITQAKALEVGKSFYPLFAGKMPIPDPHIDDLQVNDFANQMKDKMAASRAKGRTGWQDKSQCNADLFAQMFAEHLYKDNPGNLLDLANLLMMINFHDGSASHIRSELRRFIVNKLAEHNTLVEYEFECFFSDHPCAYDERVKLALISKAIAGYRKALENREHGAVAMANAIGKIEHALGLSLPDLESIGKSDAAELVSIPKNLILEAIEICRGWAQDTVGKSLMAHLIVAEKNKELAK